MGDRRVLPEEGTKLEGAQDGQEKTFEPVPQILKDIFSGLKKGELTIEVDKTERTKRLCVIEEDGKVVCFEETQSHFLVDLSTKQLLDLVEWSPLAGNVYYQGIDIEWMTEDGGCWGCWGLVVNQLIVRSLNYPDSPATQWLLDHSDEKMIFDGWFIPFVKKAATESPDLFGEYILQKMKSGK